MAPNIKSSDLPSIEYDYENDVSEPKKPQPRQYKIIYAHVALAIYYHLGACYGLYLLLTSASWKTVLITVLLHHFGMIGFTAGNHRLFAHRAFKATKPLQILLMLFHTLTCQKSVVTWVWMHRLHHKYTDTDADPHNNSRGLFFSHMGWLMVKYHPDVKKMRKTIDMSDIMSNPMLVWQKKNAYWFLSLVGFVIPTGILWLLGELLLSAWFINVFRVTLTGHTSFILNSLAHAWGYKPYDTRISASHSLTAMVFGHGEGFHNFHHTFPSDYRTSEYGNFWLNPATLWINFFAKIGWAYDLKTVSEEVVETRSKRTGDGSDLWGRKVERG